MRISITGLFLLAVLGGATACEGRSDELLCGAADAGPVPCHPYLADSPWPITHQSPYAQASTTLRGPEPAETLVVEHLTTDLASITLAFSALYPDGGRVIWGSSGLSVFKVDPEGDTLRLITSIAKQSGVDNLISGAYTLVDRDGLFYLTEADAIDVYADSVEGDRESDIVRLRRFQLPDPAEHEAVIGLSLTWDGWLAFATSHGRVGVLSRDFEDHHLVTLGDDEEISNSLAVDESGGLYVVSSHRMHRVQWTGSRLSLDPADGAWSAPYETGPSTPVPGRLGTGSGATPSLMGSGADEPLVVITDGQQIMHLVLFWRDAIPEGWQPVRPGADPRIAAELPITFGTADATTTISEQSVLVDDWRAVVVNNDYGPIGAPLEPITRGIAPPGVEQFEWEPTTRTLRSVWTVPDVSCPNGIPAMSRGSGLMYCIGKRGDDWTLEGFDWLTGAVELTEILGPGLTYNSTYAGAEIGPARAFYSGTFTGLVRVRPLED